MPLTLITPPSSEPVTLEEAKAWLRVDASDEDGLIGALVAAARAAVEAATRRAILAQTWRLTLDRWPASPFLPPWDAHPFDVVARLDLPLGPVAGVAAIRVYDGANVATELDAATYALVGAPDDARLLFSPPPPSPGRAAAGIEVDVVAGVASATAVPQPLKTAILMLVARWFEDRGDAQDAPLPVSIAALIAPWRRARLA